MKCHIRETGDSVEYVMTDRTGLTDQQIKEMFYKLENGVYVRRYSRNSLMFRHDFSAVERNYNRHKQQALSDGFSRNDLEAALSWTVCNLNSNAIRWWLTGSAALFARGFDVSPHDIDVMTYKTEIPTIEKIFSSFAMEPFEHVSGWVVKGFGALDHNFRIDFAFEPEAYVDQSGWVDFGPFAESHLEKVEWRGQEIKVPPLEAQLLSNESRKRTKLADMIKDAIRTRKSSDGISV